MSRRKIRRIKKKKNKEKDKKLPPNHNPRARRIFFISLFILIWASLLSTIGSIVLIINNEFDLLQVTLNFITFICLTSGTVAVWRLKPPFHHLIFIGAGIDLYVSLSLIIGEANPVGYLRGILSFFILYLGFRFPLDFEHGQATFRQL